MTPYPKRCRQLTKRLAEKMKIRNAAQVPVTIPIREFVRRWCLHIQPNKLTKTRYFGGWSNDQREAYLDDARFEWKPPSFRWPGMPSIFHRPMLRRRMPSPWTLAPMNASPPPSRCVAHIAAASECKG